MADSKRLCCVCSHRDAALIATALLSGVGVREVARRYGLDKSAVSRHQRQHLIPLLTPIQAAAPAKVQAIADQTLRLDVMASMRDLHTRTLALLTKAEASNDMHVALRAIRECRGNLEMLGRLDGSLDGPVAPTTGNVTVTITYIDKALIAASSTPPMLTDGE